MTDTLAIVCGRIWSVVVPNAVEQNVGTCHWRKDAFAHTQIRVPSQSTTPKPCSASSTLRMKRRTRIFSSAIS